jgi:LAO/AO transport system kinase
MGGHRERLRMNESLADTPRTTSSALAPSLAGLLARFRAGERAALARAISVVEDERAGFEDLLHELLGMGPRARRVGITGPPGAGKSSLLANLATAYRGAGEEVGVVAVDPTSPFSGGALLGDRIRMNDLATDPGIFIRSMATRGSLGGLATTSREVIDLMDVFGLARLLVETVGVGQTELDITAAADTVVVVLVPESGDAIQTMKAGLMEIADVFVVNKSDRPGADRLASELRIALQLRAGESLRESAGHHGAGAAVPRARKAPAAALEESSAPRAGGLGADEAEASPPKWEIPVLKAVAQRGEGTEKVLAAVESHRSFLEASGELGARRRRRTELRIREVVERELERRAWSHEGVQRLVASGLDQVGRGEATPYSVARGIVSELIGPS